MPEIEIEIAGSARISSGRWFLSASFLLRNEWVMAGTGHSLIASAKANTCQNSVSGGLSQTEFPEKRMRFLTLLRPAYVYRNMRKEPNDSLISSASGNG